MNETDISKCPFFRTMEQCDYKQLQKLKADNDKLKKELEIKALEFAMLHSEYNANMFNLSLENSELRKENETLKSKIERIKDECVNNGRYFQILEIIKKRGRK